MSVPIQRKLRLRLCASASPLLAVALAACAPQPEPRTVIDFMDDGIAREGVLTRCNESRDATAADEECANARRAATAIALQAERARAPQLEQQSEAKLLALRDGAARQVAAEQNALAADRAASEAAYEARWGRPPGSSAEGAGGATAAPAYGAPIGSVLPSLQQAPAFVYAEGADPLGRRSIEISAAEPPLNELVIESPRIEVTDLAVVARPFRDDVNRQ